jgi:hypothetical protein
MTLRLLLASIAVLALAACGSQNAPTSAPASPAAKLAAPTGPQGWQIASNLQHSLKHQMNAKARKEGASFRAKSVTCIEQGRQKATCLALWTDETSTTVNVVISADGTTYVSH